MVRILLALTLMAMAALPGAAQKWQEANTGLVHADRDEVNGCIAFWIEPDMSAIGKWWHAEAVINKVRQVVWNDDWQLEFRYTRGSGKGRPPKMYDRWTTMMKNGQMIEGYQSLMEDWFVPYNENTWPLVIVPTPKMWDVKNSLPKKEYSHSFLVHHCGFAGDQNILVRVWARNTKTGERVRVVRKRLYMPWSD
ncbi:MAG: hypothetical protein OXE95_05565 [Chloroflexi bacterium]|nr:hypothetical protein [Chloroflexota bacterium]MCY4247030.1 hypothetical protein [Chloroflexota bacterium]